MSEDKSSPTQTWNKTTTLIGEYSRSTSNYHVFSCKDLESPLYISKTWGQPIFTSGPYQIEGELTCFGNNENSNLMINPKIKKLDSQGPNEGNNTTQQSDNKKLLEEIDQLKSQSEKQQNMISELTNEIKEMKQLLMSLIDTMNENSKSIPDE